MDVVVLVAGLSVAYALRAVIAHSSLVTASSIATFVTGTLPYALPTTAAVFVSSGLYSSRWSQIDAIAVAAATGWASVGTLFAVLAFGPADAPLIVVLPAFAILAVGFPAARAIASAHLADTPA